MATRRLFVALARGIRESIQSKEDRERLARAIMPALRAENPRFDYCKFISAAVGD